ncbi:MAG: TolC family protein [Candidatus Acidiferrales bacterium]
MIARKLQVCAALLAAASMTFSPLYAQTPGGVQTTPATPAQTSQQPGPAPAAPAPPAASATNTTNVPPAPFPPMSLSLAPDYSHGRSWFPNVAAPYMARHILEPQLTNSPRLTQLIQDGKLNLTLQDAVALALENNLDIAVQRYTPWINEMNLLAARAGSRVNFDPNVTMNLNEVDQTIPIANPLISGVGVNTNAASSLTQHQTVGNFGYSQGFAPGTEVALTFNNNRTSSSASANVFNPSLQSTLGVSITQPLLNGFGILPNERFIIEQRNNVKIGEWQFKTSVINDITTTTDDYWNLVQARQQVNVEQQTVSVDQTLYNNNQKQLEIGTMAPLDVLTAQSQLASDRQALIVAQTVQLEDETKLLNDITKNPQDPILKGVEVVPTTPIPTTDTVGNPALDDAVQQAWAARPELQQVALQLKNDDVEVKVTKNALLPTLNLVGQYSTTGLGGVGKQTTIAQGSLIPNPNAPILLNGVAVPGEFVGEIPATSTTTAVPGGISDAWDSLIHSRFPTFQVGLQMTLPIRNRVAQANNGIAQLNQRQEETLYQEQKNAIYLGVRNALIAVSQSRNAVAAASTARQLAQQTFEDEQKKYQLGSSDSYTVALRSRDLTLAETTELQDEINLVESIVALDQAMGHTLETHSITISGQNTPNVVPIPNIPGTPVPNNGPVTPNQ